MMNLLLKRIKPVSPTSFRVLIESLLSVFITVMMLVTFTNMLTSGQIPSDFWILLLASMVFTYVILGVLKPSIQLTYISLKVDFLMHKNRKR